MAIKDIGGLRGADETLNHQIVDTFATLAQSDLAWTEKIWASIARTDGALQLDFGLGKYHNRGIIDGFGGVSRGREQWTVRASRELDSAPEEIAIGPVHYEIVEPLKQVRFRLEPNDVQPISFDIVLSGVTRHSSRSAIWCATGAPVASTSTWSATTRAAGRRALDRRRQDARGPPRGVVRLP